MTTDVQNACDVLSEVYNTTHGVVALDGDVKNSTGLDAFASKFPKRSFESFIAEQNMVGVALGLAVSGKIPYAATFACFLTRAYVFIRMAGHSKPAHLVVCGSHAGVSIGEDPVHRLGIRQMPHSGTGEELLDRYGISSNAIEARALQLGV